MYVIENINSFTIFKNMRTILFIFLFSYHMFTFYDNYIMPYNKSKYSLTYHFIVGLEESLIFLILEFSILLSFDNIILYLLK